MRRTPIFSAEAAAEIVEAADWYEAQVPGLGLAFADAVEVAVERIADNPLQYATVYKTVRRVRLRRFPYALFYIVEHDAVHVLACFHSNRDPRKWQERS